MGPGDPSGRASTARSPLADRSRGFTGERIPPAASTRTASRGPGGGQPAILSRGSDGARGARSSRPPSGAPRPVLPGRGPGRLALLRPSAQLTPPAPGQPYPALCSSVPAPSLRLPLRTAHAPLPKMAAGPPLKGRPAGRGAGAQVEVADVPDRGREGRISAVTGLTPGAVLSGRPLQL